MSYYDAYLELGAASEWLIGQRCLPASPGLTVERRHWVSCLRPDDVFRLMERCGVAQAGMTCCRSGKREGTTNNESMIVAVGQAQVWGLGPVGRTIAYTKEVLDEAENRLYRIRLDHG